MAVTAHSPRHCIPFHADRGTEARHEKPDGLAPACTNTHYKQKTEEVRSPSGNQKHRTSLKKSSDVLPQKYGGLSQRSPMFSVSETYTSSRKKVLCFSPTFLHQFMEIRLYIGDFGCRKGCRMLPGCRIYPAFPQRIWDFLNKLIHVSQVESENKRMRPRHAPKGQRAHSPGQPTKERAYSGACSSYTERGGGRRSQRPGYDEAMKCALQGQKH